MFPGPKLTRRAFLKMLGFGAVATAAVGSYAVLVEPLWRLRVTRYRISPPNWTPGLSLKVAILTDFHACNPWMSAARISRIVERTNALQPDLTLLLGDFTAGMPFVTSLMPPEDWARSLAALEAPLGRYAILGNHDWWEDHEVQKKGVGPPFVQVALEREGVPVFENQALRIVKDGHPFWLAGLGDQLAFPAHAQRASRRVGRDDLAGTLAQVSDAAPILLMAHEPDIFPQVKAAGRAVSLTLSGHTHGGQIRLWGYSPRVPSRFGNRYAYGHVVEDDTHLVVSGGLGCSIVPVRLGVPPEIVLLDIA